MRIQGGKRASSRASVPELSVLVPTHGRPERVAALLDRLDAQTLAPSRFELVLVDDGSPEPVAIDPEAHAFDVQLLRQENAGPAAARNRGLERCSAPLTLILNDDAVPAGDLLEAHLRTQAATDRPTAVLGTFQFTDEALRRPFVQLLASTNLLFDFPGLRTGVDLPWTFFWTCNLSVPTRALREVGGFDAESFPEAIVEDVELGFRLGQRGLVVRYEPAARAWHDHALSPADYFERSVRLGANLARMYTLHGDPRIIWFTGDQLNEETRFEQLSKLQATVESYYRPWRKLLTKLEEVDATGRSLAPEEVELQRRLVRQLGNSRIFAGMLEELEGSEATAVLEEGPPEGSLTSVIVPTRDALDQTRRCLEALRRSADPRHPTELIFVDNGSADGTAGFLDDQPDVLLVRNPENLGAPRARNQGIELARGEQLVFMDSDVMVTPGWLRRMLHHVRVDGRSGCVGCLSDRAAQNQQLDYAGGSEPTVLGAFAEARAASHDRQFRFQPLSSSFLWLVRREVVDALGGFDERFSPWGFEDDDYSLRAHLAGFRNRVALDVFVRHEGYGGTKAEVHAGLLGRNWRAFAAKWGAPEAAYGDYASLAHLRPNVLPAAALKQPLETSNGPPSPLPSPANPESPCRA